jgi:hypothetical protein
MVTHENTGCKMIFLISHGETILEMDMSRIGMGRILVLNEPLSIATISSRLASLFGVRAGTLERGMIYMSLTGSFVARWAISSIHSSESLIQSIAICAGSGKILKTTRGFSLSLLLSLSLFRRIFAR